ncbi:MAG: hypothetical protein ACKVS9_00090 [Phycisphaerae bacterium]
MMVKRVATSVLIEKGLVDICFVDTDAMRYLPRPLIQELRKASERLVRSGSSRTVHKSGMMADVIEAGLRSLGMLSDEFERGIAAEVAQSARTLRETNRQTRQRQRAEERERARAERDAQAERAERERLEAEAQEREAAEASKRAAAEEAVRESQRAAIEAAAAEGEAFLAAVGGDPTAIDALLQPTDDADTDDSADADDVDDDDAGDESGVADDGDDDADDSAIDGDAEPVGAAESEDR